MKLAFSRPVFLRSLRVVATVTLAVLGIAGKASSLGVWIAALACGLWLVSHELMGGRWGGRATSPLGSRHEAVFERSLRLVADLADLAGRDFGVWVVDLYLPKYSLLARSPARSQELGLALHVGLTDSRNVEVRVAVKEPVIGASFEEARHRLWWDEDLASSTGGWGVGEGTLSRYRELGYGVISAHPVVNSLGTDCRGVLVVHVRHDAVAATKALAVLGQEEGRRRVASACRDIFDHLRGTRGP